jgi:dTDP-4-dehydrorhamnose reductase
MKILLIGSNGQVGWELQRSLTILGDVRSLDRPELELSDADNLRAAIRQFQPDLLVNAAAYTAVDKAETEPQIAMQVNADAPRVMAEEMNRLGGLLVTYSTDFVYDGTKEQPYLESDPVNPINAYGVSKSAGDRAILETGCAHLILRTSWVYGARGRNFMRTMLRLATSARRLQVVDDQIGAPTWSRDIANGTLHTLSRVVESTEDSSSYRSRAREVSGIYHMTSRGTVSWRGFATAIMEDAGRAGLLQSPVPEIAAIRSDEYPTAARRPMNSRLSGKKLLSTFGISLPHWRDSLSLVISELADAKASHDVIR